jgi:hypothetical protein
MLYAHVIACNDDNGQTKTGVNRFVYLACFSSIDIVSFRSISPQQPDE